MVEDDRSKKFDELRQLAEAAMNNGDVSNAASNVPHDIQKLIHELEVQHIELEMQFSELLRAYEELDQIRHQYAQLFEFAPVGYVVTDEDGVIHNINMTAAAMLATERDKLLQQRFSSFIEAEYKDVYYLHRRDVFRSGKNQTCEIEMVTKDGSRFSAQLNSELVSENSSRCRTAISNINQLKQAEDVLRQALFRERELNDLRARLILVVSHELRTPLTVILSSAETLENYGGVTDPDMLRRFQSIRNSVWHMNDVINDVLLADQMGGELMQLKLESFNIVDYVRDLLQDLESDPEASRIQFSYNEAAGGQYVVCDRNLVRRIVNNLTKNAMKYSPGRIEFQLYLDNESLTFHISDQGEGILESDEPYIYNLFYRGNNTRNTPGIGAGLAIAKRAVEAQGGSLRHVSRKGQGATFIVRLPRRNSKSVSTT